MSEHLDPVAAGTVAATGTSTFVHLRSPTCSLLLEVSPVGPAGTSPLPRIVHWGSPLRKDVDAAALVLAISPPIPQPPSIDRHGEQGSPHGVVRCGMRDGS